MALNPEVRAKLQARIDELKSVCSMMPMTWTMKPISIKCGNCKNHFCCQINTKIDCLCCDKQSLLAPDNPDANRPASSSPQ